MPRTVVRPLALLVVLGISAAACGLPFAQPRLLTGVPSGIGGDSCFTNWAAGPLVVDPEYGTAIIDFDQSSGEPTPVMWRPGFSARRLGSEVAVLDAQGNVVATTGRRYRIAGGYVDIPDPSARVFWACDFVIPQP